MKCAWKWCGNEFEPWRMKRFCSRKCSSCSAVTNTRRRLKQKAIEFLGGKCSHCGYNKSTWALEFHHIDRSLKKFAISTNTRSWEKIKKELENCVLLCSNCHAEEEESIYKNFEVVA